MRGYGSFDAAARFCSAHDERRHHLRARQLLNETVSLADQRRPSGRRAWRRPHPGRPIGRGAASRTGERDTSSNAPAGCRLLILHSDTDAYSDTNGQGDADAYSDSDAPATVRDRIRHPSGVDDAGGDHNGDAGGDHNGYTDGRSTRDTDAATRHRGRATSRDRYRCPVGDGAPRRAHRDPHASAYERTGWCGWYV